MLDMSWELQCFTYSMLAFQSYIQEITIHMQIDIWEPLMPHGYVRI